MATLGVAQIVISRQHSHFLTPACREGTIDETMMAAAGIGRWKSVGFITFKAKTNKQVCESQIGQSIPPTDEEPLMGVTLKLVEPYTIPSSFHGGLNIAW